MEKYAELANRYQFIPIAVASVLIEPSISLGPIGIEATYFLQELGRRIVAVTQELRSMSFLWQRLSVAVQRGNASSICRVRMRAAVTYFVT